MRPALLLLFFALCTGCMAVRRVHLDLPGMANAPRTDRAAFEVFAAAEPDVRDALQVIAGVTRAHRLLPARVRYDLHEGRGTVAAYSRGFHKSSWSGDHSWQFECFVDVEPESHRLTIILVNVASDEVFDAVYRDLQARLRARFGADRVSTFWM